MSHQKPVILTRVEDQNLIDKYIFDESMKNASIYSFWSKAVIYYWAHLQCINYYKHKIDDYELIKFDSCNRCIQDLDNFMVGMKKCKILIFMETPMVVDILDRLDQLENLHTLHVEFGWEEIEKRETFEIHEGNKKQIAQLDHIIFRNLRVPNLFYFKNCSKIHFSNCTVTDNNLLQLKNAKSIVLDNCYGVTGTFRQEMEFCEITIE